MGRIIPKEPYSINEEKVLEEMKSEKEEENLPVSAEFAIVKSFGKEKVRRLK